MNKYLIMIDTGASLLNIMLWPLIIVMIFILQMNTFLKILIILLGLFYIYASIYNLQNTPYKLPNIRKSMIDKMKQ